MNFFQFVSTAETFRPLEPIMSLELFQPPNEWVLEALLHRPRRAVKLTSHLH
jgi:hypothetical protein